MKDFRYISLTLPGSMPATEGEIMSKRILSTLILVFTQTKRVVEDGVSPYRLLI